jgi:hypothetical protein
MADSQFDIAPVTADPYVAETKDKLQALRKGLNINLGPTPQIPTVTDVRRQLGPDVDKPITSFDEYTARQGLVRGQEENLSQIESGQKQRIGALESQQAQEQKIVEAQKKAYAADKANEVRRGQESILQEMDATNSKEFHFSQENMQSIATLFSLLGVIAIGGGKGSRLSVMNTMNSLTGMMKGWQQGRADVWKREKEEFEKNMAKTRAKLEAYSKKAELAWKTMPYDIEKSNAMMDELVAETGSQIVREKANLQGIPAVATYLNNLFTGYDTQFDKFMKSEKQRTDLAHQKKMEEDSKERLGFERERIGFEKERIGLERQRLKAATERRDQKAMDSIGPALRSIAEQYPDGTANTLVGASPDDKKRIQGAFRAVEESENTADFVARNPRAVGALAAAKNFLKVDSIKSFQNDDEGAVVAAKAAEIDRQLDAGVQKGLISKDDAEAAKVLQKRLFGLALSDVQGSGQRGSVYLDKQFQNLYDQSSRANTLLKIIRERAEENNRNLRIYKLNVERNEMPERFPLIEANTQESFDKYIKDRAPAAPSVPDAVKNKLSGQKEGSGYKYDGKIYRIRGGIISESER